MILRIMPSATASAPEPLVAPLCGAVAVRTGLRPVAACGRRFGGHL